MLKEFKEFAMRGNVIDLAVGVIILIKQINLLKRQPEAQPPPPPSTKECA